MYEHPYLAYRVTTLELEHAAELAERQRMMTEHPERIVRRPGIVERMLAARSARRLRSAAPATTKTA